MTSIVIPAHDEGAVIERCLAALLEGSAPGELDVVVVANGCRDDTAQRARRFGDAVRVIELAEASKHAALVAGDAAARGFPRLFVDADVVLPLEAVRRVARALEGDAPRVAAPPMAVDLDGASWAVRSYYAIWTQLPYHREGTIGSGVYALSRAGRARFASFPDLISDDGFVRLHFAPDERIRVDAPPFTIRAPRRLRDLLAVKTRSQKGWLQLRRRHPELLVHDARDWGGALGPLLRDPRQWAACGVYAAVLAVTRFHAWRLNRSGRLDDWERDHSSRERPADAIGPNPARGEGHSQAGSAARRPGARMERAGGGR